MEHFLKFPQSILTANLVHMPFSTNSMSSKHPQSHNVPEVQGGFLSGHNFQNFTFEASKFSQSFSPFVPGLASGCGSRGNTPLHQAAEFGRESMVERLLEAKAAVDVEEDAYGRGLGGGYWGGKPRGSE